MMSKKNSVLIVDDETTNISVLKTILSPEYTVYASTGGQDAIETAGEFLPDVILLDVLMPDMDGYAVIAALKNSEKTRDIPVIFVTGLDNAGAEEKGLALGAADYITKPFSSAIVKLRIQNQFEIINRTAALRERLKQQALMAKISYGFLSDAYIESLFTDTLRMVGEFMGIAQILLYKIEEGNKTLICYSEWLNPGLNLTTRIGDRLELSETMLSVIQGLMTDREGTQYLHSGNLSYKAVTKPYRKSFNSYITMPIFVKGKMYAVLDFSKEDDNQKWNESEIGLAVLVSSIFAGVFERDAMERQYSIVEHSPILGLYITADAAVEYVNPAVISVTGYTRHELITGGLGVIFDETTLANIKEKHIPNATRGEEVLFEIDITRKDGAKRIMMVSIFQTGKDKFGIITNDLTKIRELEKEAEKIYYDGLTGIYNRRFFDENMDHILKSSSRSGGTLSLLMIDIDFFKRYNDTYGHSAGDDCLRIVAGIFSKCLPRADDFVARYGGEEFVVVLPNTDEKGARIIAEKLLENIRERNILHENSDVVNHVTISIGGTTGKVAHTHVAGDFIRMADKMLYKSKQSGRDRYSFENF